MLRAFFLSAAFCLLFASAPASAAEIHVIASNALKEAYAELVPAYEKSSGDTVVIDWRPAVRVPALVASGEKADIAILPDKGVDDLIAKGFLEPGSRVDLARSPIGVAIRIGAPRPDIASADAVKEALLESKSIVISGGTSSFYLKDLFRKMGIADAIAPKLHEYGPESGTNVPRVLSEGKGDLGFTQAPQFLGVKGIAYIGPLPPEIQDVTVFSAGLMREVASPEEAKALLRYLTSSESARVLKRYGLDRGRTGG